MSFENLKSARGSSIDQLVKAAGAVSEKSETKSSRRSGVYWDGAV